MRLVKRISQKIKDDGWRSLFSAVIRKLNDWRDYLYRNLVLRNRLVTRLFAYRQPTVLLLSYPRSGSSWAGAILSQSKDLTYLFEPVTRPYQKYQAGYAMADLSDPAIYRNYKKYSQEAFGGMPPKHLDSSEKQEDFSLFGRKHRQLLIKEVNPRATELFCKLFQPTILFLIRHPASVALSFWERGWLNSLDVQKYAVDFEGDDWEKFGFAYGIAMQTALKTIQKFSLSHEILVYENLANDPYTEFRQVYEYLRVEVPGNYDDIINEYCFSGTATQGYETRRISSMMIEKWKDKLSPEAIAKLQKGYLHSGFEYYRSNRDWELKN